jgi:hypothetical protein
MVRSEILAQRLRQRRFRRISAHGSALSRQRELLILCARIGFNP